MDCSINLFRENLSNMDVNLSLLLKWLLFRQKQVHAKFVFVYKISSEKSDLRFLPISNSVLLQRTNLQNFNQKTELLFSYLVNFELCCFWKCLLVYFVWIGRHFRKIKNLCEKRYKKTCPSQYIFFNQFKKHKY